MDDLISALEAALANGDPVVWIRVAEVQGSSPREAGASMIVGHRSVAGTIGGGVVEQDAISAARRVLGSLSQELTIEYALGPEIGQCCGGRMVVQIQRGDSEILEQLYALRANVRMRSPLIVIYGSGHVGRALAAALNPLPFQVQIVDEREDQLSAVKSKNVVCLKAGAVAIARCTESQAAHVVMTHSHSLDSLICATLLERGDFAYLGLIGSKTKKAMFQRAFREIDIPEDSIARLVCPIGGSSVRDKRPEVIAAMVTAELITVFAHRDTGSSRLP